MDFSTLKRNNDEQGLHVDFSNLVQKAPVKSSVSFNFSSLQQNNGEVQVPTEQTNNGLRVSFDNLIKHTNTSRDKYTFRPILKESGSKKKHTQPKQNLQNNQNKSPRKLNNWFSRIIDQHGEDYFFSEKLTIDEISRNAERILDDIIFGRIDYNSQSKYLMAHKVIDTLVNYCSNKLAINKAISFSLGYTYTDYVNRMNYMNDPNKFNALSTIDDSLVRNVSHAIAIVNQDIALYEHLYNKLYYAAQTQNVSGLFSISSELNNYRRQAKRRY